LANKEVADTMKEINEKTSNSIGAKLHSENCTSVVENHCLVITTEKLQLKLKINVAHIVQVILGKYCKKSMVKRYCNGRCKVKILVRNYTRRLHVTVQ
jgi:hypothetical protein